jgi:hypothetical protein
MKTPLDRQFIRTVMSDNDMKRTVEFLESLSLSNSNVMKRALLMSAIISYARPFSANRDHPEATSSPPKKWLCLNADERKLHEYICKIRDKAIAHSDFEMNPTGAIEHRPHGYSAYSQPYEPLLALDIAPRFLALADKAQKQFSARCHLLSKQICETHTHRDLPDERSRI